MRYLHTMIRVTDLDASLDFFTRKLGMVETRRIVNEQGRYTLVFSRRAPRTSRPRRPAPRRWSNSPTTGTRKPIRGGRNFGHLAYEVDNIYDYCAKLQSEGVVINRPPRDGRMAFIRTPDNISIELLQKGEALPPAEPWKSMPNTGVW